MSTETLPVSERFLTFQGEGRYIGRRAFFIRLYGCPVKCPWCDSAGTWHPDYKPTDFMALRRSVPELVAEAVASGTKTVVVTGGEPTIYDLTELTRQLHRAGIQIHLETSGGFPIRGHFDYIIISPKKAKFPIPEALELADDLKLIVEDTEAIRYWMDHFDDFKTYDNIQDIWLHVEWSQHKSVPLLELITTAIKFGDSRFRAGWQMHKNFRADTFDTRSAAPVPLGGNKALGY